MSGREHYTKLCLESIIKQNFDRAFEILLVQHPDYHYKIKFNIPKNIVINQIVSGKSLSSKRNDILKHANGEFILFVDDDIIADENWLFNMITIAKKNDSDIFWGTAKPLYEEEISNNLIPFEMYIGGFHYDSNGILRRKGLIGCNFGIRKNILHRREKFIESLGRGSTIRGGEEVLYLKEYIGDKILFIDNAVVHHHIQKHRIDFKYIIYNQFNNVISQVYINKIIGEKNTDLGKDVVVSLAKSLIPQKNFVRNFILSIYKLFGYSKGMIKYVLFSGIRIK